MKIKYVFLASLLLPVFSINAYEVPTHMSRLITIGELMDFRG